MFRPKPMLHRATTLLGRPHRDDARRGSPGNAPPPWHSHAGSRLPRRAFTHGESDSLELTGAGTWAVRDPDPRGPRADERGALDPHDPGLVTPLGDGRGLLGAGVDGGLDRGGRAPAGAGRPSAVRGRPAAAGDLLKPCTRCSCIPGTGSRSSPVFSRRRGSSRIVMWTSWTGCAFDPGARRRLVEPSGLRLRFRTASEGSSTSTGGNGGHPPYVFGATSRLVRPPDRRCDWTFTSGPIGRTPPVLSVHGRGYRDAVEGSVSSTRPPSTSTTT